MPNKHWSDRNDERLYPLRDTSSGVATNGDNGLLACLNDLGMTWPAELGQYLYVYSFYVTSKVSSIVFGFTNNLTTPSSTVVATATAGHKQRDWAKVTSSDPRVAGWASFGHFVREASGSFDVTASVIESTNCRPYVNTGVTGLGGEYSKSILRGLVNLSADYPLQLKSEMLVINGVERKAIVLEITDDPQTNRISASSEQSNLEKFVGPCDKRPSSFNCDNTPIQWLNNVAPDCDGMITLEIEGCASLTRIPDTNTVVVYCPVDIAELCPTPFVPDITGRLPGEYDPYTNTQLSDPETNTDSSTFTYDPITSTVVLPYLDCFGSETADGFTVLRGSFNFVAGVSPSDAGVCSGDPGILYYALDTGGINISVWTDDATSLGRVYTTDLMLSTITVGSPAIGGIVVNYKDTGILGSFYLAALNYEQQKFVLYRSGGSVLTEIASEDLPLVLGNWYKVTVTTEAGAGSEVNITISIEGLDDAVAATIGPYSATDYHVADGKSGFYANRAQIKFSHWSVQEA